VTIEEILTFLILNHFVHYHNWTASTDSVRLCVMFYFFRYLLLVDACVGLNWLPASFWSHVNKNRPETFLSSVVISDAFANLCDYM